jgi:hypothetical protein
MDSIYSTIFKNILIENCNKECNEKNYIDLTENKEIYVENKEIDGKRKKYNLNFYEKHKEEIRARVECELCGGFYTYYNKSSHNKTARHRRLLYRMNPQNN